MTDPAGAGLGFACGCSALRGVVEDAASGGWTHVLCHCRDCRGAYTHLGRGDPGMVPILQTTQDRIRIAQGIEHLRAFRHTRRGGLRWYAACCATPLFYTPMRARFVAVGLNADRLDDPSAIGQPVAEAFIPAAGGKTRHSGALRLLGPLLVRLLSKTLNGEWRGSPFFDGDGAPLREPHLLSRAERAEALAALSA